MIFFDTETCGLHGPTVLIQWAEDDGPIHLHHVWKEPVKDTLSLIEKICDSEICGFNLVFDWFHLCQTYTTLRLFKDKWAWPEDHIDDYALYEKEARDGPCLKPKAALDLMLHARKGPYQSTMARKDIRIKRVPTAIATQTCEVLNERIHLKDIYFARNTDPKKRFKIMDIKDEDGNMVPDFKDIVLRFNPSSGLKALAADALGVETTSFEDIELPKNAYPVEHGFAPFALAIGNSKNWKGAWPDWGKIRVHIDHWAYNEKARQYAKDDVVYTRRLYEHFSPLEAGDVDSNLACSVAAVRWRGFPVDLEAMKEIKAKKEKVMDDIGFATWNPNLALEYMKQYTSEAEDLVLKGSTKKALLEHISNQKVSTICEDCEGMGCDNCKEGLIETDEPTPGAKAAQTIIDGRSAKKMVEYIDKILLAERFHPSLSVTGTLSNRMAGGGSAKGIEDGAKSGDGLNPQGIPNNSELRSTYTLYDPTNPNEVLMGGDFASYEVAIMAASYGDKNLIHDLTHPTECDACKGAGCEACDGKGTLLKKLHGIMAQCIYEEDGVTYADVVKSKGTDKDLYDEGKRSVFAYGYGGNEKTIEDRIGIPQEKAKRGIDRMQNRYTGIRESQKEIVDSVTAMSQPDGLGTRVKWKDPKSYVESMTGFKRYFTLEIRIMRELFKIAESPPKNMQGLTFKVQRRDDRIQTASGAVRSALFAAAFNIQGQIVRAAVNHRIQSTGGELTKKLQEWIWSVQPHGVNDWLIQMLNIHDELMCRCDKSIVTEIEQIKDRFIEEHKSLIPLLKIDWGRLESWAEK